MVLCLRLEVPLEVVVPTSTDRRRVGGGKKEHNGGVSRNRSWFPLPTTIGPDNFMIRTFQNHRGVVYRKMSDIGDDDGKSSTTNVVQQSSSSPPPPPPPQSQQLRTIRNIILLIADGCDSSIISLAGRYKQYDALMSGTNGNDGKTNSSRIHNDGNSQIFLDTLQQTARIRPMTNNDGVDVIADSASTATAYATGKVTTNNFISVIGPSSHDEEDQDNVDNEDPQRPPYSPIPTVLEIAKGFKMKTGIVATSTVTHATVGAFGCHVDDRRKEQEMTKQLIHQNIDVVMGGGHAYLKTPRQTICGGETSNDECDGGDGNDLESILQDDEERGYQLCYNKAEMDALDLTNLTRSSSSTSTRRRVWCSFADYAMLPELDRQRQQQQQQQQKEDSEETEILQQQRLQPSLAEMTSKAIKILSSNEKDNEDNNSSSSSSNNNGFVLVIEGSQIDWAAHGNDVRNLVDTVCAFPWGLVLAE